MSGGTAVKNACLQEELILILGAQLVAFPSPLSKYFDAEHSHLLFSQLQNDDVRQLLGLEFLGA